MAVTYLAVIASFDLYSADRFSLRLVISVKETISFWTRIEPRDTSLNYRHPSVGHFVWVSYTEFKLSKVSGSRSQ
jgi:hypothetical protein